MRAVTVPAPRSRGRAVRTRRMRARRMRAGMECWLDSLASSPTAQRSAKRATASAATSKGESS
jgi:hypothetical protein